MTSNACGLRGGLLLGAALCAFVGTAAAQGAGSQGAGSQGADGIRRENRLSTNWSFDLRATYSDNFRRIEDERFRSVVLTPTGGEPLVVPLGPAAIETPDNVVFTAALRGGTAYLRPGLTGIVRGGVSVSVNADDASLDDRLSGTPLPTDNPVFNALVPDPGAFDGEIAQTFGLPQEQEVFVRPDIVASATARVVPDLAFVDVAALAVQQVINQRNAVALEADGQLGDVTTFVGGSFSPYLTRQIAGTGTVEARYRLSGVAVIDEQFDADGNRLGDPLPGPDSGERFANDSISHEALLEVRSGDFLDRIEFGARASAARSDESGSDVLDEVELTRLTASGDVRYDLGRSLAVLGEVGYDDVTIEERPQGADAEGDGLAFETREDDLSGVFWSVGVEASPSRRSSLRLSFGERFAGTQIQGQLTYRPTPRLAVTGRAQRQLGTGTQDGIQGALAGNSRTLQIVQQLAQAQSGSARELLNRAVSFQGGFSNIQAQGFGAGVRNNYGLNASYTARRTDLALGVSYDDVEFGGEGAGEGRSNQRFAVQGSVQRVVTRRIRASLTGRFERLEGVLPAEAVLGGADAPDVGSDQVFVSLDGSYQIGPRLSATARAYHITSEGGAGFGIAREFTENAVSAGIRWTF